MQQKGLFDQKHFALVFRGGWAKKCEENSSGIFKHIFFFFAKVLGDSKAVEGSGGMELPSDR